MKSQIFKFLVVLVCFSILVSLLPSSVLAQSKIVFAKQGCKKYSSPFDNHVFFGPATINTRLFVDQEYFYGGWWYKVRVEGWPDQVCWVKKSETSEAIVASPTPKPFRFKVNLGNLVIFALPISNHAGGAIQVTAAQAHQAFKTVLNGQAGNLYTRTDGRIMIDIIIDNIRYVGFLGKDGQIGSFFAPGEAAQVAGNMDKAAKYVQNVIQKGGYYPVDPKELPGEVLRVWQVTPISVLFSQLVKVAGYTESFLFIIVMPENIRQKYIDPYGPINN